MIFLFRKNTSAPMEARWHQFRPIAGRIALLATAHYPALHRTVSSRIAAACGIVNTFFKYYSACISCIGGANTQK